MDLHNIIIIEGVKKVGKTSLAQDLLKIYNANYYKENSVINAINEGASDNYVSGMSRGSLYTLLNLLEKGLIRTPIIIDRNHISEFGFAVYRNICPLYVYDIDERLAKLGAKVIYMVDSLDNIQLRTDMNVALAKTRMDNFISNETKLEKFYHKYTDGIRNPLKDFIEV